MTSPSPRARPPAEERPPRALKLPAPQRLAWSRKGMVSSAHYRATEAGARILASGGNAVDAAVATALALCVCEPWASGLGGQTMAILRAGGRTVALDGSSHAPNRATPAGLAKGERLRGHRASTVPTTPATLGWLARRHARLPWAELVAPAIELARDGFQITELLHRLLTRDRDEIRAGSAAPVLLTDGSRVPRVGSTWKQPALARTLERLARHGIEDFYEGEIARAICDDMERNGGWIRADDLARLPWPRVRRPSSGPFENQRVVTFPPPGAGRTLLEMLELARAAGLDDLDPDEPEGALLLAEIMRHAARNRRDRPFDPDLYWQSEERSMGRGEAERIARELKRRTRPSGETTHLSAMDAAGNVVALTQSIERVFGSCEAHPELGFLYNDYMMAFDYEDIAHPYLMRPNAVPWGSVAPTVVFSGRRPMLAMGSPGSERIVTALLQVLLRLRRQSPLEAVSAPRLHCSVRSRVSLEAPRFRDDLPALFEKRGFRVDPREAWAFYLGCVQLVTRHRGGLLGVADPRRDGSASGPLS